MLMEAFFIWGTMRLKINLTTQKKINMTIIFPKQTAGDKILSLLGKKRAVFIPNIYKSFGIYAYGKAIEETFLGALIRNKNQSLKEGWFYPDEIMPQISGDAEMED